MLLNCCTTFAVPNNFVDELLKLLHETILPKGNMLPKTFYEAKCLLMKLGLSYNSIHACRDGCCLFRKELEDATECQVCHKSRYLENSKTILAKVLRHFPLIKVIFIKMRQNHNFETWRIEGECFQESLIIPLNSTSSHSHLRQR